MGYGLERQDPAAIFDLGCAIARQLKRNGVLASTWSRGLVVAAIDGIEICNSYVRCCPDCMERKVEHKVEGELRQDIQYYHRLCLLTIVSSDFPIPLGIRFQKNGETEVACSLALLQQLVERLGRRFLDVLVADAIYLQTPFVSALQALGLSWVMTPKENQPDLLAEAPHRRPSPLPSRRRSVRRTPTLVRAPLGLAGGRPQHPRCENPAPPPPQSPASAA